MFATNYQSFRKSALACGLFAALHVPAFLGAQVLLNPGLNGTVGFSAVPNSWSVCSGSPDTQIIQGTGTGIFGINAAPYEGTSYVGMISAVGFREAFGQSATLTAGTTYTGSVRLFRSDIHSFWDGTGQLRILGGTNCGATTVLWSSGAINNLNTWQVYPISFVPSANYSFIVMENYFNGDGNGNYFCMDGVVLNGTTLAANLVGFEGIDHVDRVDLNWEIDGLEGADRLALEWSADGANFSSLAEEPASAIGRNFTYSHHSPVLGPNFYRLRIIDGNGNESLTAIREVKHALEAETAAFPNPASNVLHFAFQQAHDADLELSLIDLAGRAVLVQSQSFSAGDHVADLDLPSGIAPGVYQLKASFDGQTKQHPVVIR